MNAEIIKETVKGDGRSSWGIIHEEFVKYEREAWCFRRHEITLEGWKNATSPDTLRFFKSRGITRAYTALGYMVVGDSVRRWGDGVKVLNRWHVVKVGTEFVPVDRNIDEVLASH